MTISLRRAAFFLALCGSMPLVVPHGLTPAHAQVAPETVEISAIVRAPDGAPVEGADVVVVSRGADEKTVYTELKTDAQGRFALRKTKTKWSSQAFVHAPGYALQRAFVAPDEEGAIALKAGVTATGQVVDAQGQAVANATINLESLSLSADDEPDARLRYLSLADLPENSPVKRALQAQTGADGSWRLGDLPAESNVVFQLLDSRFARAVVDLTLSANSVKAPDLVASPGATLQGRVLNPDGKPLAGAPVNVQVGSGRNSYASTQTGADGAYSVASLPPGDAEIKVGSPVPELAPRSIKGVAVQAGETAEAPAIRLDAGVLLRGEVLDKASRLPLAGARIMATGEFGNAQSNATGADGVYSVRVPPGATRFYLYSTPENYLRENYNDTQLSVGTNSINAPDFTLQRGLTLSGTATDETGAPAAGAVISASDLWDGAQTVVAADGQWELRGVAPTNNGRRGNGKVALKSAGEWQIAGNGLVAARDGGGIAIKLKRIELQDVTLRVVTPGGEPVAGAKTRIAILFDADRGATRFEEATTNARGEVTVKRLRPNESAEITPAKEGYALQKAGVIAVATAGKTRATDAVLTPKNGTVRGRIVNAAGAPVTGASVAVLWPGDLREAKTWVKSDAQGRFTLDDLSAGEALIGAANERDWGEVKARTGADIEIKLQAAAPQPAPANRELAVAVLKGWFDAEGGRSNSTLAEYAAIVAALDPASAPALAKAVGAENETRFNEQLVEQLGATDPARAIAAARAAVDEPKKPAGRQRALLELATLLVENGDGPGAREIYDSLAPTLANDTGAITPNQAMGASYDYAKMAALAGATGDVNADYWLEMLDRALQQMTADDRMFRFGAYAKTMAETDLASALRWLDTRTPAEQIRAFEDVIPLVAKRDLPRAQQLLKQMETLVARGDVPVQADRDDAMYRPKPARSLNVAREAIIKALLPTDPRAAYQQSLQLTADGYELERLQIDTALRLPGAQALPILRAQFVEAQKQDNRSASAMARLARLVEPLDQALSEQWFEMARAKLADNPYQDEQLRESAAPFAFYRAASDPAQSRLLLENEWQRWNNTEAREAYHKASLLQNICWAMVPVNLERALQMMRETDTIMGKENYNKVWTQRQFLMWITASERERREFNFERPQSSVFDGNR